jgi:hypothetical protein
VLVHGGRSAGDKAIPLVVVGVGVMIFGGMLASLRTPQVDQDESQPEI